MITGQSVFVRKFFDMDPSPEEEYIPEVFISLDRHMSFNYKEDYFIINYEEYSWPVPAKFVVEHLPIKDEAIFKF